MELVNLSNLPSKFLRLYNYNIIQYHYMDIIIWLSGNRGIYLIIAVVVIVWGQPQTPARVPVRIKII